MKAQPYYLKPIFLIGTTLILGFLVRLYFLLDPSIWADEGQHIWIAGASSLFKMRNLYENTAHDQPFGMYPLLYGWRLLFGWSTGSMRFFSAFFSSLSILTIGYATSQLSKSAFVPWFAAILMALSPYSIRYGYDVTPYALVNAFAPLSIIWFLQDQEQKKGSHSLPLIAMNCWLLNIHYFCYFLVATQFLYSVATAGYIRSKEAFKNLGAALVIYSVSSLPILLLFGPEEAKNNHKWISEQNRSLFSILGNLLNYSVGFQFLLLLIIAISIGFAFKAPRDKKYQLTWTRIRTCTLLFIGTLFLASIPGFFGWKILGHERYLMPVFPALILIFAFLLDFQYKKYIKATVCLSFIFCFLGGILFAQPSGSVQDFDSATSFVQKTSKNKVAVLIPECCRWAFYYYFNLKGVDADILSLNPLTLEEQKGLENTVRQIQEKKFSSFFVILYYQALKNKESIKQQLSHVASLVEEKNFKEVSVLEFKLLSVKPDKQKSRI